MFSSMSDILADEQQEQHREAADESPEEIEFICFRAQQIPESSSITRVFVWEHTGRTEALLL